MRRTSQIICGVILAVGLLGAAQVPSDSQRSQTATENRETAAAENVQVSADLGRIAGALEALNADDDSEREQRDLEAQIDMAIWAERMFWASVATVVVSAIGIGLIYVTFQESRRAADAAETMAKEAVNATEAANRSATVALQASHAQLRPWLKLEVEQARCRWLDRGAGVSATLSITVTNAGVSPALQCGVSVNGELIVLNGNGEGPIDLPDRLGQMAPLFAGDQFSHVCTIQKNRTQMDSVLAEAIKSGGMPCFVFEVKVSYRTPFSDDVKVSALRFLTMGMAGDQNWLVHKGPNVEDVRPRLSIRVQPADVLT